MPPESQRASNIFISYRRDDSAGHAGRLFDRLSAHFGDGQIFMDIDHIEPGEDFALAIEEAVGSCEILIALVGRSWLTSRDEAGRRLDNPNDFVRLELAAALARGVRVIPLLVQGAQMPRPQELPEVLLPLSRRNALELSDARWKYDVDQLIGTLEKVLARQREERGDAAPPLERSAGAAGRSSEKVETARGDAGAQSAVAPPRGGSRRVLLASALTLIVVAAAAAAWLFWMRPGWSTSPPGPASVNTSAESKNTLPEKNKSSSANRPAPPEGMVYVPGGEFMMGRDDGDAYERPAHRETLKAFYIDAHEVTCGDYEKFVKEDSHPAPQGWKGGACPAGAAHKPVTGVTWGDAGAFCYARSKRLPTEQEWEFAARGADGRRYPWGDDWRAGLANADGASDGLTDVDKHKGGSPFEAFGMVGNAWEWTASKLTPYPGGSLPVTVPDHSEVIRGGSFESNRHQATTTYRRSYPERSAPDYSKIGFRCAGSPPNAPASP